MLYEDTEHYNGIADFFQDVSPECFINHETILTEVKNEIHDYESLVKQAIVEDESINTKLLKKVMVIANEIRKQ